MRPARTAPCCLRFQRNVRQRQRRLRCRSSAARGCYLHPATVKNTPKHAVKAGCLLPSKSALDRVENVARIRTRDGFEFPCGASAVARQRGANLAESGRREQYSNGVSQSCSNGLSWRSPLRVKLCTVSRAIQSRIPARRNPHDAGRLFRPRRHRWAVVALGYRRFTRVLAIKRVHTIQHLATAKGHRTSDKADCLGRHSISHRITPAKRADHHRLAQLGPDVAAGACGKMHW